METRASYLAVGAFVLALAAGVAVFVVWLGGFQAGQAVALYDIRFAGSVTGLQLDGPVRYRGISVGRVVDMQIDPENIELVRVTVEVDRNTPIRTNSVASLEIEGITAVAFVQIGGGTQESEPLPKTTKRPYPVIPSKASTLQEFFEGAPALVNRLNELADRLTLLFNADNMQAIGETLANLRDLTKTMAAENGGAGATMAELRETAQSFTEVADELEAMIAENRAPIRDFSSGGLYEASQLLTEIRQLVASFTRIAAQFERDPARFLFGDRQKGYQTE
ncbi:MAG TPA: MlaD family protein [Dongiaceae bacterium]|nr:MlaD family protein [Dongiaceae bacterium]